MHCLCSPAEMKISRCQMPLLLNNKSMQRVRKAKQLNWPPTATYLCVWLLSGKKRNLQILKKNWKRMHYMLIARSERTRHEYSSSGHCRNFSIPLACFTSKTPRRSRWFAQRANQFDEITSTIQQHNLALFTERCQNSIRTYFPHQHWHCRDNCRMQMT